MSLKERFKINYPFVNENDISLLYSEVYGETYRFNRPIPIPRYPDYFLIPNHLNYAINRNGEVINLLRDFNLKPFRHQVEDDPRGTYMKFALGSTTEYRHRLLALVFKEYHRHPKDLYVNHIDGMKGNDELDNIEWLTPLENAQHAWENGLADSNSLPKPVTALNYVTGDCISCSSIEEAVRKTCMARSTIWLRLKKPNSIRYSDGWRFKYADEDWLTLDNRVNIRSNDISIKSLDLRDGSITNYIGLEEASNRTGCNKNTIFSQCTSRVNQANNGFVFRYNSANEYFPEFTDLQRRLYKHSNYSGRQPSGCLLLNEDGSEYAFGTLKEMWVHLGYRTNDQLLKAIRLNIPVKGKKAIYIDPIGIVP